jgi:hypothetical protein
MFRRIARAGLFVALITGTPAAAAAQQGLALLAAAPANPDGSVDGIATFGGAMPTTFFVVSCVRGCYLLD